jgi:hypothetical protein
MDFGHLVEGIIEQDPMTDRFVIRVEQPDGSVTTFDVQKALEAYNGQQVRMTLATLQTLDTLARMIEDGNDVVVGGGSV